MTTGDSTEEDLRQRLRAEDALRARIKELIGKSSVNAFAKKCGLPASLMQKYLKGDSLPGYEKILEIARGANVRPAWLLTGEGPKRTTERFEAGLKAIGEAAAQARSDEEFNDLVAQIWAPGWEPGAPLRRSDAESGAGAAVASWSQGAVQVDLNDYAPIPRVDVMAAAGDAVLLPTEEIVDFLLFKKSWLRRELGIDPQRAVVVQAKGDSMKPSIRDGDLLLVEVLQEPANDDGIYVINVGGRVMVKRLQFMLDRSIKIVSDNPAYEPQVIKGEQSEGFWIVGRVVWAGSRM